MEQRGAPFDLTFIIFEAGNHLTASLRYKRPVRSGHHRTHGRPFQYFAGAIVAAPHSPLNELAMLTPAEKTCILETWTTRPLLAPGRRPFHKNLNSM